MILLVASPALGQEGTPETGRDLMGEALRLFMKGLMQEMEPAIDDLSGFLDNLDAYHPPEVLPNGDIIIRRKQKVDSLDDPDGDVEL